MTKHKHHSVYALKSAHGLKKQMDNNPIAYKTVEQVWKKCPGESRPSTEKAFKSITGYRIKEYLVMVRLQYTKQLLREGMPIKQIASKCCYGSQSAYCTAFKRFFHQSPRDWLHVERQ
jgi:AraC-like DNA-binding protein